MGQKIWVEDGGAMGEKKESEERDESERVTGE
jgi:hypothetical protein